jgi:hypothetical protein
MGSIKDIIDLAITLERRIKDRQDIDVLRQICSQANSLQAEQVEVVERDIRVMKENAVLAQAKASLEHEIADQNRQINDLQSENERLKIESQLYNANINLHIFLRHITWQWHDENGSGYCLDALEHSDLHLLKQGQNHDPEVQVFYETFAKTFAHDEFWQLVATTASSRPDLNSAKGDLEWQRDNDRKSLMEACKLLNEPKWPNSSKNYHALAALLRGQQHNRGVMDLYRACYRNKADELFNLAVSVLKQSSVG